MNLLCIVFDEKIQLAPIIGAMIAAIIVIIGWFIISYLNRRNEIKKELRGYRLEMLHSIITLQIDFQKTYIIDKNLYNLMYVKIKTFGTREENKCFKQINDAIVALEKEREKQIKLNTKFDVELKKHEDVKEKNFNLTPILKTEETIQEVKKIKEELKETERKIKENEQKIKEIEQEIEENILKMEDIINTSLMELLHLCQGTIRQELKFEN